MRFCFQAETGDARRISRAACVAGLLLALASAAQGDLIHLVNGQTLEGLIVSTNATHLQLQMGVGEIKLSRESVRWIEPGDAKSLREDWKNRFFDHSNYLPESCRDVAKELRDLGGARAAALQASQRMEQDKRLLSDLAEEDTRIQEESEQTHRAIVQLGDPKSAGLKPSEVDAYNQLITHANALVSRRTLLRNQREAIPAALAKDRQIISDYLPTVERFYLRLEEGARVRGKGGLNPEEQRFFEHAKKRVSGWRGEILRVDVPHDNQAGQAVVSVRINDRMQARLLLDTGASLVAISPALARNLGLPVEGTNRVSTRLADGTVIQTLSVRLAAVTVGDARATDVEALILPAEPAPGIDGLLGVSFLREFVLHYDASAGRLELMSLRSGAAYGPGTGD